MEHPNSAPVLITGARGASGWRSPERFSSAAFPSSSPIAANIRR